MIEDEHHLRRGGGGKALQPGGGRGPGGALGRFQQVALAVLEEAEEGEAEYELCQDSAMTTIKRKYHLKKI